jgi:hypothetical protein
MFEAYGVVEVAAKLPLEITAIAKQSMYLYAIVCCYLQIKV